MKLLVVASPLGPLGSGAGGGVELTLANLVAGLLQRGHRVTVLAAEGSALPADAAAADGASEEPADEPAPTPVVKKRTGVLKGGTGSVGGKSAGEKFGLRW